MGEAFYLSDMRIFPVSQLGAKGKWRTEAMRTLSEPFFSFGLQKVKAVSRLAAQVVIIQ